MIGQSQVFKTIRRLFPAICTKHAHHLRFRVVYRSREGFQHHPFSSVAETALQRPTQPDFSKRIEPRTGKLRTPSRPPRVPVSAKRTQGPWKHRASQAGADFQKCRQTRDQLGQIQMWDRPSQSVACQAGGAAAHLTKTDIRKLMTDDLSTPIWQTGITGSWHFATDPDCFSSLE